MSDSLKAEMINGIGLNNDAMVADGSAVGSNATDRALLDFLIGRSQLDFDTNTITEKQQFNSATKFASVTTKDGKTYIKGAPEFILNDCYYYLDKDGNVHMPIGRISFDDEKIAENFKTVYDLLLRIKPSSAKGTYMKNIAISSTMGPSVKVASM